MNLTIEQTAAALRQMQDILILTHQSPDGDTLGSGFALCRALRAMGKSVNVVCSDPIPRKFAYLTQWYEPQSFEPQAIVAVDLADVQLFGAALQQYSDKVDLCIDHHPSNTRYAKTLCLDAGAAAAAQVIYRLLNELGVSIDTIIADCIYTGLCTDTGCFRYSNTQPETMRIAAEMMEAGADAARINREMFETKTASGLEIEKMALNQLEYYFEKRCALIAITQQMMQQANAGEEELEGISAIPRQIEGVQVGITMREKPDGSYKLSLRSSELVDVSIICKELGGGGHKRAAGCRIDAPLEKAKEKILAIVSRHLA